MKNQKRSDCIMDLSRTQCASAASRCENSRERRCRLFRGYRRKYAIFPANYCHPPRATYRRRGQSSLFGNFFDAFNDAGRWTRQRASHSSHSVVITRVISAIMPIIVPVLCCSFLARNSIREVSKTHTRARSCQNIRNIWHAVGALSMQMLKTDM